MPLMGGIMNHGYQCGMVWGAALAGGAQAFRLLGAGPQAETAAIIAARRIVKSFSARYNSINCLEITDMNMQGKIQPLKLLKFFIKGGPIGCFRMAVQYAPEAFGEIYNAFSEKLTEVPSPPVSCAAMLAQKMGASEMHAVMAAGLAGGIGLSGGGCGALGAALWLTGITGGREGVGDKVVSSRVTATIDKFLKNATDFKFECTEIVGREFESISDHADYLRGGGCANILEVLAKESSTR